MSDGSDATRQPEPASDSPFQPKQIIEAAKLPDPVSIRRISMSYEGPLPPPNILEDYNRIVPNGAERIFKVFEKQVEHRHELERTVIITNTKLAIRGFYAAVTIAVGTLAGGFWLASLGKSTVGIAAIVSALGSLLAIFIAGKKKESSERATKRQRMADQ